MINYTFKNRDNKSYKRVDKRQARKTFNNYIDVVLCPVNIRPFNDFCPVYITLNKTDLQELNNDKSFDLLVNEYEFYNCNNTHVGKKSAFYVAID